MLQLKQATTRARTRSTVTFPDGPVVPDWRAVSTPSARAALESGFEAFIEPKWRGLDEVEDRIRRLILQAYAVEGEAPEFSEIVAASGLAPEVVAATLRRLAERDLVVLDRAGHVAGAYPFTDRHTEHRVEVGEVAFTAMCAIDALGIGAMLGRNGAIRSTCRLCRRSLSIRTESRGVDLGGVEPPEIVVWSGHHYANGCAASSLCVVQAFFCGGDHLETWRASGPAGAEKGVCLTLSEALQVGRAIFAPMRSEARS